MSKYFNEDGIKACVVMSGEQNKISKEEKLLLNTKAYEFLNTIEKTSMTKTYKMPLLLAFYNDGNINLKMEE